MAAESHTKIHLHSGRGINHQPQSTNPMPTAFSALSACSPRFQESKESCIRGRFRFTEARRDGGSVADSWLVVNRRY